MATLTMDKVHEYVRMPGTLEVRLVNTRPYVRITHGGEPPVFIQGGQAYSEGGQAMDPMPDWLAGEVAKLSPTVRAEVGLEVEAPAAPAVEPEPKPKPKPPKVVEQWTCEVEGCGKTMPARGKTFHMQHHKKQAARAQQETAEP